MTYNYNIGGDTNGLSIEELKDKIDESMIIELMEYWGAEVFQENEEYIIYSGICHGNPESRKLYLYRSSLSFFCYSNCGNMDIIALTQQIEGLSLGEAIQWLTDFFKLDNKHIFGRPKRIKHMPKIIKPKEINLNEKLPCYNGSILNTFIKYYPIEWLSEGISKEAMDLFKIKFDINTRSIIIPHRDFNGSLIGIRMRNLSEDVIENYGKYMPYTDVLSGITYKHPLSKNLYGLYENKKNIIDKKRVIIFESEKSTLLMNSYYPNDSIGVSVGGSIIHQYQIELLKSLDIKEVIICFDYEIREGLLKKFDKSYKKCALQFKTYILDYDLMSKLLNESDSPIDKGKEVFEKLLWNKKEYKITGD